jgi:glycyl-tRNA synthetase
MLSTDDMATFCKKKGFIYLNSEIYGGMAGFFDFGPLGVELNNNIKNAFWKEFVQKNDDVVGIDGSIISSPKVWKASGHIENFEDITLKCKKCKGQYRADHLIEDVLNINADGMSAEKINELIKKHNIKCQKCKGTLEEISEFNLMFKTNVGPEKGNTAYLRPETAQLIFTNFKIVAETSRMKLPFGIAQIGKAFRNEISPRNFLFRCREFEQFEIEFFVNPDDGGCPLLKEVQNLTVNIVTKEMQAKNQKEKIMKIKDMIKKKMLNEWQAYWLGSFYKFFMNYGIKKENLRIREHLKEELAHYATACFDIEYKFPFGWKEIHGNADRSDFDLRQHVKFSKKDLSIFDEATKKKILPVVASEPSQGIGRAFLAFMFDAYNDDKKRGNIVLKLDPKLAPINVAVFPLVNKLDKDAREVYDLIKNKFVCFYDTSGSIGRRYARQDEVGTPYCLTYDFDSKKKKDVTIRDRDSTKQKRVKIKDLEEKLSKLLFGEIKFKDL